MGGLSSVSEEQASKSIISPVFRNVFALLSSSPLLTSSSLQAWPFLPLTLPSYVLAFIWYKSNDWQSQSYADEGERSVFGSRALMYLTFSRLYCSPAPWS